ncbi:MAG: YqeG family HAD IIIA-type phosphatase [Oscillospiraceae bacterium]|nr:YqeG family HAD IIIA-type phosphatase [Oscillospiraceae bacterium]
MFFADLKFDKLTDITPEVLSAHGISLLLLDLDNTIAPYGEAVPNNAILAWAKRIRDCGAELFIISNTRKTRRVEDFARSLGIPYSARARKPSRRALLAACGRLGVKPENAAMAGDQIFTDVLAGNRAGCVSILVTPLQLSNAFLAVRYAFETPFRRKSGGKRK